MNDRLQTILKESYESEKVIGRIAGATRAMVRAKIEGLLLGLEKMDQAILVAQELEQKKRRWHLYRAAREEISQEMDPHESLPNFVPLSRRKRHIPGATSRQKMG
ncbi:hypothetical protein D4R51_03500 [bacterium]|nr:MAG: hypothetical protein D4R51_03500 [bacterium]